VEKKKKKKKEDREPFSLFLSLILSISPVGPKAMGNFKSKPTPSLDGSSSSSSTTKSQAIDKQIKADQKRMKKEVKLLLLGKKSSSCGVLVTIFMLMIASTRCWRVWKVNSAETDETDTCFWIQSE